MTDRQTIDEEAPTLEDVRRQIQSKVPIGFELLSERIITTGQPQNIMKTAETVEDAYKEAHKELPIGAIILEKEVISTPSRVSISKAAPDEQDARNQAKNEYGQAASFLAINVIVPARKGLFGIGKRDGKYKVELLLLARIRITFQCSARIIATTDSKGNICVQKLRQLRAPKGDQKVFEAIRKILDEKYIQNKFISDDSIIWLIDNADGDYFLGDVDHKNLLNVSKALNEANCHNDKIWSRILHFEQTSSLFEYSGICGLEFLSRYLITSEAESHVRHGVQVDFYKLVEDHFFACEVLVQKQIVAALENMLLYQVNEPWKLQRCCTALLKTKWRTSLLHTALSSVQQAISRFDERHTKILWDSYNHSDNSEDQDRIKEEIQAWEQFKQEVSQTIWFF